MASDNHPNPIRPAGVDIDEADIEKMKKEFRRKQSDPPSVLDVLFGNGVAKRRERNARLAILFKYITIWATLILAFSAFLIWKFL